MGIGVEEEAVLALRLKVGVEGFSLDIGIGIVARG